MTLCILGTQKSHRVQSLPHDASKNHGTFQVWGGDWECLEGSCRAGEGQQPLGWKAVLPGPGAASLSPLLGPFHREEGKTKILGLHGHHVLSQELCPGLRMTFGPATPLAISQGSGGCALGSHCLGSKPTHDQLCDPGPDTVHLRAFVEKSGEPASQGSCEN